jgi:hypothetical protein
MIVMPSARLHFNVERSRILCFLDFPEMQRSYAGRIVGVRRANSKDRPTTGGIRGTNGGPARRAVARAGAGPWRICVITADRRMALPTA